MAIWTVNYSKRNSFFTGSHDIMEEVEGRKTVIGKYNKPSAPGSVKVYRPKYKRGVSNRYLIDLKPEELDELVKEIGLVDDKGETIEKANMKNISDKFFKHRDLYLRLEGGQATLDDDQPFDKFFLACFRVDPKFNFVGDNTNPAISSMVEYEILRAGDLDLRENKEANDSMEAMDIFMNLDYNKQVKILNAMGVETSDPDPEQVKRSLFVKITNHKDERGPTGETYLEMFLRLGGQKTADLELRSIIGRARTKRVIIKKAGGKLYFNEVYLGRNLEEVFTFLSDDDNIDIKNSIVDSLNSNGKDTD